MPSIHEIVASARQRLRTAGIDAAEADLDARVLAQHLLHWEAARYFTDASEPATEDFVSAFTSAVTRRARREPLAYITGRQEFWGLTFEVGPAVLIPRPETEIIVETCLERWPAREAPIRVADACTGSGCVAIALAAERLAAQIVATDISTDALAIAKRNAVGLRVDERIQFVHTDLLTTVPGPFDAIVANPPYVPMADRDSLPPEVVNHEPHVALFGGEDGLHVVRALLNQAATRLAAEGLLIFEFGMGQSDAVLRLLSATGFTPLDLRRDLQGIPRTAVATLAAEATRWPG